MKIFLIINGHLLVVPIVFISFRLLFLTGRKGYGKKIMSASGPALLLPDLYYRFRTCIIASGPALLTLSLVLGGGWVCKVNFASNPTLGYVRLD